MKAHNDYIDGIIGPGSASLLQSLTTALVVGMADALTGVAIGATLYYQHVACYISEATGPVVDTLIGICLVTIALEQARSIMQQLIPQEYACRERRSRVLYRDTMNHAWRAAFRRSYPGRASSSGAVIALSIALVVASGGHAAAQEWHSMIFRGDAPGVDENPLRGLAPSLTWGHAANEFPHSLEWFYLPLSDVVTGPGTYNWNELERRLALTADHGNQAIVRFYVDNPGRSTGIPRYLLLAGLKTFQYDDVGNAASGTPSVAPDYSDPRLIECLIRFVNAFGLKYDGDPRIAYVTGGLYGFWGEWHVLKHPLVGESAGWAMAQKDKDALLWAYVKSFPRTAVLVRTAKVTKDRELLSHFGFHDDSFLEDTIGISPWLFWPIMQQAGTSESWQRHPIGGEIFPPLQNGLWGTSPNTRGQDWTAAVTTTHATFMFDAALFAGRTTASERANALVAQRMLGYTLFCTSARMVRNKDGSVTVTVRIENRGVAPIYYAWPVEVEALKGINVVGHGQTVWPLPELLPGKTEEWSVNLSAAADRATTVVLRIANPMPRGHSVAFANGEMGTVRTGWLTLDVVDRRSGGLRIK